MKPTYLTPYKINDSVKIKELQVVGIVDSVWIRRDSTEYEVRYFSNGDRKKEYFLQEELKKCPK